MFSAKQVLAANGGGPKFRNVSKPGEYLFGVERVLKHEHHEPGPRAEDRTPYYRATVRAVVIAGPHKGESMLVDVPFGGSRAWFGAEFLRALGRDEDLDETDSDSVNARLRFGTFKGVVKSRTVNGTTYYEVSRFVDPTERDLALMGGWQDEVDGNADPFA